MLQIKVDNLIALRNQVAQVLANEQEKNQFALYKAKARNQKCMAKKAKDFICKHMNVLQEPPPHKETFELLKAAQTMDSKISHSASFKLLLANLYLTNGVFSESLRILIDLQEKKPHLRFIYNEVQKIYSAYQKSSGKVAIKGI